MVISPQNILGRYGYNLSHNPVQSGKHGFSCLKAMLADITCALGI